MKKLIHILTGWGKSTGFLKTSAAEQKLSDLRISICMQCEHAKDSKVLVFMNGEAEYELTKYCAKCSCPCVEKSLVIDEHCPILKW